MNKSGKIIDLNFKPLSKIPLSDRGVFDKGLKFRSMILPDIFIDQDTPEKMYETAGLDSLSIANKVEETLNSNIILAKNKNKISN